jgi:hypothetical protein
MKISVGRRLRALGVLVPLAALTTAGFCVNPSGSAPKPDRCDAPAMTRGPLTVEVGPYEYDLPFRAFVDGDAIAKVRGPQGGEMVAYRLRVSGAEAPACLAQVATLSTERGEELARLDVPLATYPDGAARTTRQTFLIFSGLGPPSGTRVRLAVDAGGTHVERTLRLVDFILPDDLAARD